MGDSKIEIYDNSNTDEHFINQLNNNLSSILRKSFTGIPDISLNINNCLYSNSPVMSLSNSDDENDCFDDINEYSPKETFQKLTFQDVKRSLAQYYETEDKYSDELDLLMVYLNGQKNMYIQAKQLTQYKLNILLFPTVICSTALTFFSPFIMNYAWSGVFIASINAMITACLSILHYLKLESSIDLYSQLV